VLITVIIVNLCLISLLYVKALMSLYLPHTPVGSEGVFNTKSASTACFSHTHTWARYAHSARF